MTETFITGDAKSTHRSSDLTEIADVWNDHQGADAENFNGRKVEERVEFAKNYYAKSMFDLRYGQCGSLQREAIEKLLQSNANIEHYAIKKNTAAVLKELDSISDAHVETDLTSHDAAVKEKLGNDGFLLRFNKVLADFKVTPEGPKGFNNAQSDSKDFTKPEYDNLRAGFKMVRDRLLRDLLFKYEIHVDDFERLGGELFDKTGSLK